MNSLTRNEIAAEGDIHASCSAAAISALAQVDGDERLAVGTVASAPMPDPGDRGPDALQPSLIGARAVARHQYLAGIEFESHEDFAAAALCYGRAIELAGAGGAWRQDLILRKIAALKALCRFEEALTLAHAEMSGLAHSPELFVVFGDLLLAWAEKRPSLACGLLPMIESSWLRALQLGEFGVAPGLAQRRDTPTVAQNLALMFEMLGNAHQARAWHARAAAMRRLAVPEVTSPA